MSRWVLGGDDTGFALFRVEDGVEPGARHEGPGLERLGPGNHPLGVLVLIAQGSPEEAAAGFKAAVREVGGESGLNGERVTVTLTSAIDLGDLASRIREEVEARISGAVSVTLYTGPKQVEELVGSARTFGDRPLLEFGDADVDAFYACLMCQSVSPGHVCIISPDRPGNCGITWSDADVSHRVNPDSGYVEVEKGEELGDGEYRGVNRTVQGLTGGEVDRLRLYDVLDAPQTTCGCRCYDVIVFYLPERDGFGLVHEGYRGETPLGLTFAELARQVGTGSQISGLQGVSWEYLFSDSFLRSSGGLDRVVWMTDEVRRRLTGAGQ